MRILVIEDDPTVGQYVRRGLEEQRWSVELVADGEEGERRAGSEAFDLIVLDMRLPGKSGLEVLHSLRARGFAASSSSPASTGLRVSTFHCAVRPQAQTGSSGGQMHPVASFANRAQLPSVKPSGGDGAK